MVGGVGGLTVMATWPLPRQTVPRIGERTACSVSVPLEFELGV